MAPKKSKTIKTKAKRVSTKAKAIVFDQITFQTITNQQRFQNLIQYRNIWPERQINLNELPLSVHWNL